jgi:hypothetical protein
MKHFLLIAFLFSASLTQAQDPFEKWNNNYPEIDFSELIESEQLYADSISADTNAMQNYARIGKYRFVAVYTGKTRTIDPGVVASMKRAFGLLIGKTSQLDGMLASEYLFNIEGKEVWMPIQVPLEESFQKEIKKKDKVLLYCLFLNEYTPGKLYNTFFISEFTKVK